MAAGDDAVLVCCDGYVGRNGCMPTGCEISGCEICNSVVVKELHTGVMGNSIRMGITLVICDVRVV